MCTLATILSGGMQLFFNCVSQCDTLQAKNTTNSWIYSPAELIRSCHIFLWKTNHRGLPLQQQSPPIERPSANQPHCECVRPPAITSSPRGSVPFYGNKQLQLLNFESCDEGEGLFASPTAKTKRCIQCLGGTGRRWIREAALDWLYI